MTPRPSIAILTPNILAGLGLKGILEGVMPMAEVELYTSFEEFAAAAPERFFHYFISAQTFLAHEAYFRERRRRCILLTQGAARAATAGMHTIDVLTSEEELIKNLMALHHGGHNTSAQQPAVEPQALLTSREHEVLQLIAAGERNKQIAAKLGISLSTVITHRRNIMEKMHARSAADLILTAISRGYLDSE